MTQKPSDTSASAGTVLLSGNHSRCDALNGMADDAPAAAASSDAPARYGRHPTSMIRGLLVLLGAVTLAGTAYLTATKWAIRHETLTFVDKSRNRVVEVDLAVRRDKEMAADAGMMKLPVAILNHGNTVKFTEYSFLANLFAARGYMAVSIQHDLEGDAPLVTHTGELYVGRLPVYERGVQNILFAVGELEKLHPNADYAHLTMVGHSNGGDIAVYFAKMHPDQVERVVTLDNLRVPFMTDGKFKILSFRSEDPVFKADPGVIPEGAICEKSDITVIQTEMRHTDMSDRGPAAGRAKIEAMVDRFLRGDSVLAPVPTDSLQIVEPQTPISTYNPIAN